MLSIYSHDKGFRVPQKSHFHYNNNNHPHSPFRQLLCATVEQFAVPTTLCRTESTPKCLQCRFQLHQYLVLNKIEQRILVILLHMFPGEIDMT